MSNELRIELSCGRCNFTKTITVNLDEDGVFTIPNKFCPNDLSELSRKVLRQLVSVPKQKLPKPLIDSIAPLGESVPKQLLKPDEPTEDTTEIVNPIPRPARPVDVPKHGVNSSKKT